MSPVAGLACGDDGDDGMFGIPGPGSRWWFGEGVAEWRAIIKTPGPCDMADYDDRNERLVGLRQMRPVLAPRCQKSICRMSQLGGGGGGGANKDTWNQPTNGNE